ncbi:MAG: SMI1/KNR4 family protein [Myxococcota bacterium]
MNEPVARLRELARSYGGTLPASYEVALQSFDSVATERGLSDAERLELSTHEFLTDVDRVIEVNGLVREGEPGWSENHASWPRRLLVIGDDDCGGYYFVDLSGSTAQVGYFEHEEGEFEWPYANIASYLDETISEMIADR